MLVRFSPWPDLVALLIVAVIGPLLVILVVALTIGWIRADSEAFLETLEEEPLSGPDDEPTAGRGDGNEVPAPDRTVPPTDDGGAGGAESTPEDGTDASESGASDADAG